jgi:hypothetical protein
MPKDKPKFTPLTAVEGAGNTWEIWSWKCSIGQFLCQVNDKELAELICKAVNTYYQREELIAELVGALEGLSLACCSAVVSDGCGGISPFEDDYEAETTAADAALAKAKEYQDA